MPPITTQPQAFVRRESGLLVPVQVRNDRSPLVLPEGMDAKAGTATAPSAAPSQGIPAALMRSLVKHYPLGHKNLTLVTGGLDLTRLGEVGRVDETGQLEKAVLSVPYALAGPWDKSPSAKKNGFKVDVEEALSQHSAYVKLLLDRGVKVFLTVQPPKASEAVYATDTLTGMGHFAVVGQPSHEERRLETQLYMGGMRLSNYGDSSVEFGDVLLAFRDRTLYVVQAYNSWRADTRSIGMMDKAIAAMKARGYEHDVRHVAVKLSGEDTLHNDYVLNYAGPEGRRSMLVHPQGFADPDRDIPHIREIFGVSTDNVIVVADKELMIAGACNLSNLSPHETVYAADPRLNGIAAQLAGKSGITVTRLPFSQMSQKDGVFHCATGQAKRSMPG